MQQDSRRQQGVGRLQLDSGVVIVLGYGAGVSRKRSPAHETGAQCLQSFSEDLVCRLRHFRQRCKGRRRTRLVLPRER